MSKHSHSELNELYRKADSKDSTLFSEMKSNVLLVNSEHYKSIDKKNRERLDDRNFQDRQKIRITKNHIHRITARYKNGIMGLSPEMKPYPANPSEIADKKAAELFDAVLQYGKNRYKLEEKKEDWCDDFIDLGEVACKVYFDYNRGDIKAYEQAKDEEGQPIFLDENGEPTLFSGLQDPITGQMVQEFKPMPDVNKPKYAGDFVFETVHAFNLLRDPEAESMEDSSYYIVRKMIDVEEVEKLIPDDDENREEKLAKIKASSESTYRVFDTEKGSFEDGKGKIMLREYYFKPGPCYPRGYYYITTEHGELFSGELPFSVFPIAWRGFKKIQTSARARSIIKILRPYQYELNRSASKEVEHQLVHGDDKVITPPGGKLSQGALLPGMRHYHAIGQPIVVPGRTGDQYVGYQQRVIQEMYEVVDEQVEEPDMPQNLDSHSLLYRSIQRKKKYGKYARTFQCFLEDVYWIYLRLAKKYFDKDRYIKAVGKNEGINFAEFASADELSVQIKLIETNEDSESLLGKMIQFNHVLQYVGKDIPKEALGEVLTNLPYANSDQVFSQMTLDSKNVENDMLAMDRGENRPAQPDDNHDLYIKKLTTRIKSPDFKTLPGPIQQMYQMKRDEHRGYAAVQAKQLLLAEQQAIPSGGNLVKVDMYSMENGKQVRATFPDEALKWLQDKLTQQGLAQERLDSMATVDQAAIAQQLMMNQQMAPQQPVMPIQGGNIGPVGQPI
jgi:hypothetical protein